MDNLQQFVRLAVDGGWKSELYGDGFFIMQKGSKIFVSKNHFLRPELWKAVGYSILALRGEEWDYQERMRTYLELLLEGKTEENAMGEVLK